jgi:hypothetical protein
LRIPGNLKTAILKHAPHGTIEIRISIGQFGKRIFPQSHLIIAFSGRMDMKAIKLVAFDPILVLVTLSIIAFQPDELAGLGWTIRKDNRKIHHIENALADDYAEFFTVIGTNVELSFSVSSLRPHKKAFFIVLRQPFGHGKKNTDFGVI